MSDYQRFLKGELAQNQTWWGKRIANHATDVLDGMYGKVLSAWRQYETDGAYEPTFFMDDGRTLKATPSGVFKQYPSGGWGNISLPRPSVVRAINALDNQINTDNL